MLMKCLFFFLFFFFLFFFFLFSASNLSSFLSCCLPSTEARWPIRDGDGMGRGRQSERLDRGNRPKKTGETVDRRQNSRCPLAIAQRLVHCAIAVSAAVLDRVTKTMSVAPLLTNNLDNLKQKDVQLAQHSSTSLLMISSGQM